MKALTRYLPPSLAVALALQCGDASNPPIDGRLGARVSAWLPDSTAAIAHEYYTGLVDGAELVIADQRSWARIWAQLYTDLQPQPSLPSVDFRTERVLLAALGQRSTGGYDIRVDSVVQFSRGSVAFVTAIAPGRGCVTTQALTQPVDVVRLSPPPESVSFQQRPVVRDCF